MKVTALHVRPYRLRLRRPLRTAAGAFVDRHGTLVCLTASGTDVVGQGDVAPWPGFGTGGDAVAAALATLPARLTGHALPDGPEELAAAVAALGLPVEVAHGVEQAALACVALARGVSVAALLGPRPAAAVPLHALCADATAAQAAVRAGYRAVKMKIGYLPLADDVVRVGAARAAVGDACALRLDVNGGWSREVAARGVRLLAAFAPEWIEQPLPAADLPGMAALRALGAVPIAADEALGDGASLAALLAARACDVAVVKPMFAGGIFAATRLCAAAEAAGVTPIVTHALESAVGRAGALAVAAARADGRAAGLGPALAEDLAALPEVVAGHQPVPPGPGFGLGPLSPRAGALNAARPGAGPPSPLADALDAAQTDADPSTRAPQP